MSTRHYKSSANRRLKKPWDIKQYEKEQLCYFGVKSTHHTGSNVSVHDSPTNLNSSDSCIEPLFSPTKQHQHSAPAVPATHLQKLETSSSANHEGADLGAQQWQDNFHLHCPLHEELASCPKYRVAASHNEITLESDKIYETYNRVAQHKIVHLDTLSI